MPICEYLEETYPEPGLLPKDPIRKARVRAFCEMVNSGMQPLQNLKVLQRIESEYHGKGAEWAKPWIADGLRALEAFISKETGKYTFGDQVTLADVFLIPQALSAQARFGIDLNDYPRIAEVVKNLNELPEFEAAKPQNQPDFEA
eukprot:TRINITY_DN7074_c0_g1_i4.p1 TRINITY_DN7074_c0_g1~~TRINITY_DN7074_c0_g1_i4.p1  ORF type:complete len:145 (+),score=37.35 TRINITY_DN7074_c0_g1_i4:286-720(+)